MTDKWIRALQIVWFVVGFLVGVWVFAHLMGWL